ncbi:unnamed protein product [Symbiodinium sp. CCMP2592]|nr:unnamed protein product [Symbiodinium sp. CCMP2592]
MRRAWPWPWPLLLVAQGSEDFVSCIGAERRAHVATFASELDMIQSAFFASTSKVFGEVAVLDYGRGAEWPKLTVRLHAYKDYVFRMMASQICDFVLFVDGYDSVVTGSTEEIVDRLLALESRTGKPVVFGAETQPDKFLEAFQELAKANNVSTPWRYLNAGLMAGRVWALRTFFQEILHGHGMDDPISDQVLCANFSLFQRPDLVALDYQTELFLNAFGIEGILDGPWAWDLGQPPQSVALVESQGQAWIENRLTKKRPLIFHFPGPGKFSKKAPCLKNPRLFCLRSLPFEVVRLLLPEAYKGWRLESMQDLFDDLSTPWLPRWNNDDYLHFQRTWGVLEKIKLRERIISYMGLLDLLLLALFALFLYYRVWRLRGCSRLPLSLPQTLRLRVKPETLDL